GTHVELPLESCADARDSPGDLSAYECFSSTRGLVIEKDPVRGEKPITLPVIHCHPMCIDFRAGIRAGRPEWSSLTLRVLRSRTKHFAAGSVVELSLKPYLAYRFQQTDCSDGGYVTSVFGKIKTNPHVALCSQVVDFVRL